MDIAQARALIDNKDSAFWKNDPTTVEQVNKAFESAHPGEADVGGDLPAHLNDEAILGKPSQANLDKPIAKAEGAETAPVKFSQEWDFSQEESDASLKQHWGPFHYLDHMIEIQNPDNFKAIFGGFIKNENDTQFLREIFSILGNNPHTIRLYRHLIGLVEGE